MLEKVEDRDEGQEAMESIQAVGQAARNAALSPTEDSGYLPFRPYERLVLEHNSIQDYGRRRLKAAFEAGADQLELRAAGGRTAAITSIRRHVPNFDPREAQEANGPAWLRLKPLLVRAGLYCNENTTLTEIMAFLDDLEPTEKNSQDSTSFPVPRKMEDREMR